MEKNSYEVQARYSDHSYWTWTERVQGMQSLFTQEKFISANEWKCRNMCQYFDTPRPHSSIFLLHYVEPDLPSKENPVLFVHGAGHSAEKSWRPELILQVGRVGRPVFAVTFAHPHGDNLFQAVQLHNAIRRILELTNGDRVDLVAHSKGGIVAWTFLAGWGAPWGALPHGLVDKYFMLGTPNRGLDYPFRHVSPNWWVKYQNTSAPVSCDSMLWYGHYIDTTEHSLYEGGAFPGLSQLLFRWDDTFPVHIIADTLYFGGQNWLMHSKGIEGAIQDGGNYMEKLLQSPVEQDLELHVLAGNLPIIQGWWTEWDGPSDGLVFVESVLDTDGLTNDLTQVKRKTVLPLNHLDLLYHPTAHDWVLEGLLH
ncbi:triacylglycerol lipase [Ammoniphilus sp. YIM 78166]|uniref:esterase/lipase family protein n=1 Tax=Ammoniphilus sp. YIM 78166 TaxID=1644106 RepID=UPI00106FD9DD|nr:acetyltransferase [Ammoniphilus sp. YIM 78166]